MTPNMPANDGIRSTSSRQQLAILKQLIAHSAGRLRLCLSAADNERCREDKVLAMVAYIEGAGGFDGEGRDLQAFMPPGSAARSVLNMANPLRQLGVNGLALGSPDTGPGLDSAGIDLIKQVNALKMQMDVSHMNEKRSGYRPSLKRHRWWPPICRPRPVPAAAQSDRPATAGDPRQRRRGGRQFRHKLLGRADGRRDSDTPQPPLSGISTILLTQWVRTAGPWLDFDGITCRTSWAM